MATQTRSSDATIADLQADIAQLRQDLTQLGKDMNGVANTAAKQTKARAREAVNDGLEQADEHVDSLREQVRHYPLQSCGAALGIGVLAGLLMRSR